MKQIVSTGAIIACACIMLTSCIQDNRSIGAGGNTDTTAPSVLTKTPANLATGVAINGSISVSFTEEIDPSTIDSSKFYVSTGGPTAAGSVVVDGRTATFNPSSSLAEGAAYTATVKGTVADLAGNELGSDYTWTFTTASGANAVDTISPTVISTSPVSGGTGIAANCSINIVFSEAILASTVTSGSVVLKKGYTTITGSAAVNGSTVIFTPTAALDAGTTYTVTVSTTVADLAGNSLDNIYTFTFTTSTSGSAITDNVPPQISSTSPSDGTTGISRSSAISILFNEKVDAATVNEQSVLVNNGSNYISGTVTCDGYTAVFTPASSLSYSTLYMVTVTKSIEDVSGNALSSDYSFTFTTEAPRPEIQIVQGTTVIVSGSGSIDFGNIRYGYTQSGSFTIRNNGAADLALSGSPLVTVSGANAAEFSITQPTASTVSAGGSVSFSVTFAPSSAGSKSAVVTISSNDSSSPSFTFTLKGTCEVPQPEIQVLRDGTTDISSGGSVNFGSVNLGSTANSTFTIKNTGVGNLVLSGSTLVSIGGANPTAFTVTQPTASTIVPGGSTDFSITFNSSTTGSKTAVVTIANNDSDEGSFKITVNGTCSYNVGKIWTQVTSAADWSARTGHTSLVFDNKMWVMGGYYPGYKNDVWYSEDGITWTQATTSAAWSARYGHTSVIFDNKIWVIGGCASGSYPKDVWYSTDGATWIQTTSSAGWTGRSSHTSVVFNNKIWVIGGNNGGSEVWCSSNGISWTQMCSTAEFGSRSNHASVVYDNKIWVMGGYTTTGSETKSTHDVWYSTDGVTWTQATSSAAWIARNGHASVVFDNKMWVLGGNGNNVWYSMNGSTWNQAISSAGWESRSAFPCIVYDAKMWILGGRSNVTGGGVSDIWYGE